MGNRAADDSQLVTAGDQFAADRFGHILVQSQPSSRNERGPAIGIGVEGTLMMTGDESWNNDRLVWLQTEIDVIEQQVECHLVLQVTTGDADGEDGLAVFEHECWSQGNAGSLAGFDAVGMPGGGVEAAQAIAIGNPGGAAAAGVVDIGAGRGGDEIAPAVGDDTGGGAAEAGTKTCSGELDLNFRKLSCFLISQCLLEVCAIKFDTNLIVHTSCRHWEL